MSLPAIMMRSARLRVSVSVVVIQPLVWRILRFRSCDLARSMIDDAARLLGKRQYRAHAPHIGGKAAEKGKLGLADEPRRFLDRSCELDILAVHRRARRRQFALEACDRLARAVLDDFEPGFGPFDHEVVAKRATERVHHVLEQFLSGALAFRLARAHAWHAGNLPQRRGKKAWDGPQHNSRERDPSSFFDPCRHP